MNKMLYNILIAPIVIFVRLPVMAVLWVIVEFLWALKDLADEAYNKAEQYLPGFRR